MENILGIDSCGQKIIPIDDSVTLRVYTNHHPDVNGTRGWIGGCTLNIRWNDSSNFKRDDARKLVNDWNWRIKND